MLLDEEQAEMGLLFCLVLGHGDRTVRENGNVFAWEIDRLQTEPLFTSNHFMQSEFIPGTDKFMLLWFLVRWFCQDTWDTGWLVQGKEAESILEFEVSVLFDSDQTEMGVAVFRPDWSIPEDYESVGVVLGGTDLNGLPGEFGYELDNIAGLHEISVVGFEYGFVGGVC